MEECPLCGELNTLRSAYCQRCNYRLPWADMVEGRVTQEVQGQEAKTASTQKVPCRFCEGPIAFDAKQCPHYYRWLISRHHEAEFDPWQADFNVRNSAKVDMLQPKAGCLSVMSSGMLCLVWLLRHTYS